MRIFRLVASLFILGTGFMLLFPLHTDAQSSNVSIGVSDTLVTVKGYTSPFAQVTIQEGISTLATASSDSSGFFATTLPAQSPGIRNFTVNSTTPSQYTTDNVTKNVDVIEHASTEVNYFLPPTIETYEQSTVFGTELTIRGSGRPGSTLKLIVDSKYTYTANIDASGNWIINIPTGVLSATSHSFTVILSGPLGQLSDQTVPRTFNVTSTSTNRLTNAPNIVETVAENPVATYVLLGPVIPGIGIFPVILFGWQSGILNSTMFKYWWQIILIVLLIAVIAVALWLIIDRRSQDEQSR